MDFINIVCLVTIISYTFTKEEIFIEVREYFKFHYKVWYLVNCPYCFSFWVALGFCVNDLNKFPSVFICSVLLSGLLLNLYEKT